jgi:hypothetical protein
MRTVIALLEIDDDKAIAEDLGTIEFLEKVCSYCSVINLQEARILDDDDEYDAKAIELAKQIFEEE